VSDKQGPRVYWDGYEGAAWRAIVDGASPSGWLAEAFDNMRERYEVMFAEFPPEQQAVFRKDWENSPVFSSWRNLSEENCRLQLVLADLIACISQPPGDEAHRRYSPSGPVYVRAREALSSFFGEVLERFDTMQLPLKRLDAAALEVERGEAIPGPLGSVLQGNPD